MITITSVIFFAIVLAFAILIFVVLIKRDLKSEDNLEKSLTSNAPTGNSMSGKPDKEFQLLQYKLRMQKWVSLSQIEWQIATISVAVTVGVLAAALTYVHNPLVSGLTLAGGAALDFSLASAIAKNHLIGVSLEAYIRDVEKDQGLAQTQTEANDIVRYISRVDKESYGKREDRFLRFFQRRDLEFLLVVSILAFSMGLLGTGLYIIITWSIP